LRRFGYTNGKECTLQSSFNPTNFNSISIPFWKITTADGKGAEFLDSPNFNRPFKKRISPACMIYLCHHRVSVREGTSITIVLPFWPFKIKKAMAMMGRFKI
jgi:hypothetical protein